MEKTLRSLLVAVRAWRLKRPIVATEMVVGKRIFVHVGRDWRFGNCAKRKEEGWEDRYTCVKKVTRRKKSSVSPLPL